MLKEKIIYITYDGIFDFLGQSQVLKYLSKSKYSNKILLISFEKKNNLKNVYEYKKIKEIVDISGIDWNICTNSEKVWFISKIFDLFKIIVLIYNSNKKYNIKTVHCRSYLPTFAAYILKFFIKFNLIFDMRGFWVDERYEWSIWSKNKFFYKVLKFVEYKLIKCADKIIVLCNDAKIELIKNFNVTDKNITIIPTCADEKQFFTSKEKYWGDTLNLCHLGTIKTRYDIDFTLRLFNLLDKKIDSKILFINKGEEDFIKSKCIEYKINRSKYEIRSFNHYEIQNIINKFDYNIFFPKKGYYTKGFFPTKIAESLLSGVPIITNFINKEIDNIFKLNKLGFQIYNLNEKNINELIINIKKYENKKFTYSLREFAKNNFSLDHASKTYDNIYKSLLK